MISKTTYHSSGVSLFITVDVNKNFFVFFVVSDFFFVFYGYGAEC